MAAPSLSYTLTNGTAADADQVMQNLNDLLLGYTDGTKDLTISALTCNGNVALGDASSDTITFTGQAASGLAPNADGTLDLGSTTNKWQNIYGESLRIDNTATDGGAIYFDAGTTEYIKASADGTNLEIGGFTSWTGPSSKSAISGWAHFTGTDTPVTINESWNLDSITDGGAGIYTMNWDVDFAASGGYFISVSGNAQSQSISTRAADSTQVRFYNLAGTLVDSSICAVLVGGARV